MQRVNEFLDRRILPWPVRFLTQRFVILATIALLVPLIVFASKQVFVMLVNSYLNTMGVAVSSIVLLYATIAEIRDRQSLAMQEQRAQEDHHHVVEMHRLVLENMEFQHEEVQGLKRILAELHGVQVARTSLPHGAQTDLKAMHPRGLKRFEPKPPTAGDTGC